MHRIRIPFFIEYILLMQKINQNMRKHELNVCKFNFVDIKPQMVWKRNKQTTWLEMIVLLLVIIHISELMEKITHFTTLVTNLFDLNHIKLIFISILLFYYFII